MTGIILQPLIVALLHMYAESYLEVIQIKPLSWQNEKANDILRCLDDRILSNCPPQSRHQAKKRIQGDNSFCTEQIDELPALLFN